MAADLVAAFGGREGKADDRSDRDGGEDHKRAEGGRDAGGGGGEEDGQDREVRRGGCAERDDDRGQPSDSAPFVLLVSVVSVAFVVVVVGVVGVRVAVWVVVAVPRSDQFERAEADAGGDQEAGAPIPPHCWIPAARSAQADVGVAMPRSRSRPSGDRERPYDPGLSLAAPYARRRLVRSPQFPSTRQILLPFTGTTLSRRALEAAIRLAKADEATLMPAFLATVPLTVSLESPLPEHSRVGMPLLEVVEQRAAAEGVPIDSRVQPGRSYRHALARLLERERFDRVIISAADNPRTGPRAATSCGPSSTPTPRF